jgi:predicted ArsR family transcriptional regulator
MSEKTVNRDVKSKFLGKGSNNPKYLILREIKRSQGLSVSELCERVGLSYMGVKQHCVAMEKEGYLDTWRRPKGMGRPEKAYRLTSHAQEFFPTEYGEFTCQILDSVQQVYGPTAAEKILFNIYKQNAVKYSSKIKGTSLEERARELAAIRDEEGYMSDYTFDHETRQHVITDYNCPIMVCFERYTMLRELERQMFEKVLSIKVVREEQRISGLYKCIFRLGDSVVQGVAPQRANSTR